MPTDHGNRSELVCTCCISVTEPAVAVKSPTPGLPRGVQAARVIEASGQSCEDVPTAHGYRPGRGRSKRIKDVIPPAPGAPRRIHTTGVSSASGQRGEHVPADYGNGTELGSLRRGRIAELTVDVFSPAPSSPRGVETTRVIPASSQ